jgi:predicted permease
MTLGEKALRIVLPPTDRRHVLDELEELRALRAARTTPDEADRWRRRQVWLFVVRALPTFWWRRPFCGFLQYMANRDGGTRPLDTLLGDIRFGARAFIRRPGFALAVVGILAVGIGATTTIYSVVDTVMLRPLPYPDSWSLVHFGGYGGVRPRVYVRWRDGLESMHAVEASSNVQLNLTGSGAPKRVRASRVTAGLLSILGASPHLGRLLAPDDYQGGYGVGVLGYGFWQRQWGGDLSVIGQSIQVEWRPVVVAGVLSPAFEPPAAVTGEAVDLWLPLDVEAEESFDWSMLSVVGRLRDGVGYGGAQRELDAYTAHLAAEMPHILTRGDGSLRTTRLIPLRVATFRDVAGSMLLLLWSVLLMLLIACANVANLLLAHAGARSREMALRGALGAGRPRLFRQLITESLILALAGGAAGVGLAVVSVGAFRRFIPAGVPRIESLSVDPGVLLFSLGASVATGLVFGIVPAVRACRRDVAEALKDGGASSGGLGRGRPTRSGLVVAEIALAFVLLTSAGLFFRSLSAQAEVDPGFSIADLITVPLHLGSGYDEVQRREFTRRVRARLEALPGSEGAAAGLTVPFQYVGASRCCISNTVRPVDGVAGTELVGEAMIHPVSPGWFRTLGAAMPYGREFTPEDGEGDERVAIINEPTARHFFGTRDAVGRSIRIGDSEIFRVVGVTRGVYHWGMADGVTPDVYLPYDHWGAFSDIYHLTVRSALDLETLIPAIKEAIWAVDPELPVEDVVPMTQRVDAALAGQRFLTRILGTFAGLALLLATGGVYAFMLFSVGQRRSEMGIRLALGARGGQLLRMVLMGGLLQTGAGVALGLTVSVGVAWLLRRFLFGISVVDGGALVPAALALTGAALLATLLPAWRASRTDPLETLRVE